MTIITKPQLGPRKDEEKKMSDVELGSETNETVKGVAAKGDISPPNIIPPFDVYLLRRRRRLLSSLCIGLLVLWLILGTMVAGILLYRYLTRRPTVGFCATDIFVDNGDEADNGDIRHVLRLQQKALADPYNNFEKIEVPQFGDNRPAVFVHDFRQNLTAIVDLAGHQCFIKALDKNILPPRNFSDLMRKMTSGYYEQNTKVIAERWIAKAPPLTRVDLFNLNSYMIGKQCLLFDVYWLEKMESEMFPDGPDGPIRRRRRRSTGREDGCASTPIKFVEFEPKHAVTHTEILKC